MKNLALRSSAILITAVLFWPAAAAAGTFQLRSSRQPGDLSRVALTLEMAGEFKQHGPDADKVASHKVEVSGRLKYDEKVLELPGGAPQDAWAARYYHEAAATYKIEEHSVQPALRDQRRLIGVKVQGKETVLYSPAGSLSREEADLLTIPANTLLLDRLLPDKAVAVDESWRHDDDLLALLLGFESVTKSTAESRLLAVADGLARLQLSGRVEGKFGGVDKQVDLKGKYQFDLAQGRIVWFGLLVKECREISEVAAGTEELERLQIEIKPLDRSERLSAGVLREFSVPDAAQLQLFYRAAGGQWELSHDRCWYLHAEDRQSAVLRMIDGGQRIAQCNIATLANAAPDTPRFLDKFKIDVRQALGKNFGDFVEASEEEGPAGNRICRVVVQGVVGEVPVHWHYYLVTDRQGHQAALAFTLEAEQAQKLQDADRALVESLRFNPTQQITARPTRATK